MALALLPESVPKLFTPETLRSAAKQSERIHLVPLRLRRAIKKFLRDTERTHMNRKVLRLSESFSEIKSFNLLLPASTSRELVEDPFKSMERSKRWKVKSAYGDIGLKYSDDHTIAYVASRMPAVYSACHRVLKEVRRRLPDFAPAKVLDFGAGTGSAFWALCDIWPRSLEKVNLVEPSKSMQRACQSLLQDMKDLPLIHSYDSIQSLAQTIGKHERQHDLVIASYVLGEIPSLKDRITIVRQLWDLTQDVLVLVEPGTPHGSSIIRQMRSHILWMEKRKCRKSRNTSSEASKGELENTADSKASVSRGAFVVAPCAHDGRCPLENSTKYCHFVQRLERTSSQRTYKRSKGVPLRGFEDEKFSFVALRRGERPKANWPLDGMKFETLKELHAKRNPEDLEIDYEDQFISEADEESTSEENPASYGSDVAETDSMIIQEEELEEEDAERADLGSGWGRIIYMPVRRGKRIEMDICRSVKQDGSEGSFERVVITKSKNPALHHQARRSLWGDLWPC